MKLRNREINIFSMSALDLFASALGAFILLTVVSLPYFSNTGSSDVDVAKLRKDLGKAQSALQKSKAKIKKIKSSMSSSQAKAAQCMEKNRKLSGSLNKCSIALKKKFVLVVISWGTTDDIDMHVIDPQGREFYYKKKAFSGTPAKLEEDSIRGPGNEIWLHPAALPGTYKVYYKLYKKRSRSGKRIKVRGSVITPKGKRKLRDRFLVTQGSKTLIAIIKIDSEGKIKVNER